MLDSENFPAAADQISIKFTEEAENMGQNLVGVSAVGKLIGGETKTSRRKERRQPRALEASSRDRGDSSELVLHQAASYRSMNL